MFYWSRSLTDTSLLVAKITFVVTEIIFKVAVIPSLVDKISLFVAEITFVVAEMTFNVAVITLSTTYGRSLL